MKTPAFKVKKLRGKGYIEVAQQVLLWRKNRKKHMPAIEKPRQRALKASRTKKQAAIRAKAYDIFGSDT